eukprot:850550-Pelagomonas_calceolata.AAC.3
MGNAPSSPPMPKSVKLTYFNLVSGWMCVLALESRGEREGGTSGDGGSAGFRGSAAKKCTDTSVAGVPVHSWPRSLKADGL